jgi:hypothetical protein
MHWKVGRVSCTFKVRLRRGWADLREFLAQVRRARRWPLGGGASAEGIDVFKTGHLVNGGVGARFGKLRLEGCP